MKQLVARLADATRAAGGFRIVGVAPSWLVRREFLVFVRELSGALPPVPSVASLRWSTMSEADVAAVRGLDPSFSEEGLKQRLAEGQECRLGWIGDTLAYFRWDAFGPTHLAYLGLTLRPLEGDVISGYSYTRPDFRGRGLHTAGFLEAMRRARDRGRSRSIALVAAWNRPALRVSADRAASSLAGRVGFWNLGVARRYFCTGTVSLEPGHALCVRRPQAELPATPVSPRQPR